jgi:hypothetical protein
MNDNLKKWLKTTGMAVVGGGIASTLTAMFDPQKYNIVHDFGSGKLWVYFFEGAGVTFLALLVKSPLGQQVITAYEDSQKSVEQAKAELKPK